MATATTLRDQVRRCVETVESEDVWSCFDTFWYSERVNVTFGIADAVDEDPGLSCQIEVIDPAVYFDPDGLAVGRSNLAETHPSIETLVGDLTDAIASVTGEESIDPFVFRGLEPAPAASSAIFDTTIRDAG